MRRVIRRRRLLLLAVLDPSGAALAALSVLHAPSLSDAALIDAVAASQKLLATIAGKQQELLAEIARRDPDGEQFLRDEVACVLQTAPNSANLTLEAAKQLTGRLADTHNLLTGGFLPYGHARTLALGVRHCSDEVAAKVQERVLPRGCRQSAGEFRCAVRRAVARFDRKDEAVQHAEAFAQRNVITYDEPDYMADVVLHLAADGAATVLTAINTWAVKTDTADTRTLDQRRADAIVDICSSALDMPGLPKRHGLRPALSVTVAASTLAGQDDQPAELDGYGPIPASMARRIAALPGAVRHEIPVDNHGHILVQNTDTADTYTPPARIARTVIARDVTCVHPGCGRSAHYCDLDHRNTLARRADLRRQPRTTLPTPPQPETPQPMATNQTRRRQLRMDQPDQTRLSLPATPVTRTRRTDRARAERRRTTAVLSVMRRAR